MLPPITHVRYVLTFLSLSLSLSGTVCVSVLQYTYLYRLSQVSSLQPFFNGHLAVALIFRWVTTTSHVLHQHPFLSIAVSEYSMLSLSRGVAQNSRPHTYSKKSACPLPFSSKPKVNQTLYSRALHPFGSQ